MECFISTPFLFPLHSPPSSVSSFNLLFFSPTLNLLFLFRDPYSALPKSPKDDLQSNSICTSCGAHDANDGANFCSTLPRSSTRGSPSVTIGHRSRTARDSPGGCEIRSTLWADRSRLKLAKPVPHYNQQEKGSECAIGGWTGNPHSEALGCPLIRESCIVHSA